MCSVDASIMLINCQTFANFVEILYAYKSKDIFYVKKLKIVQNQEKKLNHDIS